MNTSQINKPSIFHLRDRVRYHSRHSENLEAFLCGHVCLQLIFDSTSYSTTHIGVFMNSRETLNQMSGDYSFDEREWSVLTSSIRSCRLAARGIVGDEKQLNQVQEAIKIMIAFLSEL